MMGNPQTTNPQLFLQINRHTLNITPQDIHQITHIINKVGLRKLHGNASAEQVALALTIFIKEEHGRTINIKDYNIYNEHGITYRLYSTVLKNLLKHYRQNQPTARGRTI